jgi:hypothetical protein
MTYFYTSKDWIKIQNIADPLLIYTKQTMLTPLHLILAINLLFCPSSKREAIL